MKRRESASVSSPVCFFSVKLPQMQPAHNGSKIAVSADSTRGPLIGLPGGLNNDYDFDREDLNILFGQPVFSVLKFPVKQVTTWLCDLVIEEFVNGKTVSKTTRISSVKKSVSDLGNWVKKYFKSKKKDSVYFHRLYFFKDTDLAAEVKTKGYSANIKSENANTSLYALRATRNSAKETNSFGFIPLSGEKDLLFLLRKLKRLQRGTALVSIRPS